METKKAWVDFKAVKEAVSIQMVLDRYSITELRKSGDELRGPCRLHHEDPRGRSFSVNLTKNVFRCFNKECKGKRGGNILDFVAAMDDCSVRDAALKLALWFKVGESEQPAAEMQEGQLARLTQLVSELEIHREQINYHSNEITKHAFTAQVKIAVVKELVAELDKKG